MGLLVLTTANAANGEPNKHTQHFVFLFFNLHAALLLLIYQVKHVVMAGTYFLTE